MNAGLFVVGLLFITFASAQSGMPQSPAEPENIQIQNPETQFVTQGEEQPLPALTDVYRRDPFRLPSYLIERLTFKEPPPPEPPRPKAIDDQVDPLQRWPATEYVLVGIIWDVKKPKALLKDPQSRVHIVKMNDRVGNKDGVVTSIKEGTIVVLESGVPLALRLKK